MRRVLVVVAVLATLGATTLPTLAQDLSQEGVLELPVSDVDTSQHPDVSLTVTVPRTLVGLDLSPANFFVSEAGAGRDLTVEQLPADQLQVVLVLDTSGSMRGTPLQQAKEAAGAFAAAMPAGVEMALVTFGDTPEVRAEFGGDHALIVEALSGVPATGETALYDALLQAAGLFETSTAERKTVIVLSDGGDTISKASLEEAIVGLLGAGARVFGVELQSPENDSEALERLTTAAAGAVVPATDPAALGDIFDEIASDLINQYRVSFASDRYDTTTLVVAVRKEDTRAVARLTARYPAPPPGASTTTTTVAVSAPPVTKPAFEVPPPTPFTVTLGWMATSRGFVLGSLAVFLAIFGAALALQPRHPGTLSRFRAGTSDKTRSVLSELANRATLFTEERLQRGTRSSRLRLFLDRAGLKLRNGEFVLILASGALAGFALGYLVWGPLEGGALGAAVVGAGVVVVKVLGERRAAAFRGQFPDVLQLVAGGLRAGFGLVQSIAAVAAEELAPASEEFNRVRLEVQLGRDLLESLTAMADRVQSDDLRWAAEAFEVHQEVGGDLSDLVDRIAATMRERETVRRQIQVLSAEGTISALVLVALPIVLAAITRVIAPDYFAALTTDTFGRFLLVGAVVLMGVGIVWIRRVVRLDY